MTSFHAAASRLIYLARWLVENAVGEVFSWSEGHLRPETVRMFRLHGLHPGPDLDIAGAAALIDDTPSRAAWHRRALRRAHLVEETGPNRYAMHDLVRGVGCPVRATGSEIPPGQDEERSIVFRLGFGTRELPRRKYAGPTL